ncbi:ribokinase [Roseibium denhamense]|uniref:Ribokinase n=1 Tax=Roseibium denhamense TaxID=76305 RepID=A0ABY1NNW8_9HYPH|nr:ribokinase [Roseibium denhamense]MTI07858.1 ribokinase [Roseibium denhamense]SMP14475.1 ribokinase [Roseibium denhamense]
MSPVTVFGSINVDLVNYLDRWPAVGETVAVKDSASALGGKGANQAVAATRMGADVTLIGAVGGDSFGQLAEQQLAGFGVKCDLFRFRKTATGTAFIDVGPDGDNIIRLARGANDAITAEDVRKHKGKLAASSVLLLQNEVGLTASIEAARLAKAGGALVIMDPAPAPDIPWGTDSLAAFDVITPNASETGGLLGAVPQTLAEALEAAQELSKRGLRGAIITMGGDGVAWWLDGDSGALPAPRVDSVDTVAAGDCFNGALASELADGKPVRDAIGFAMRAAAVATTRMGAAASLPTRDEIARFYAAVPA